MGNSLAYWIRSGSTTADAHADCYANANHDANAKQYADHDSNAKQYADYDTNADSHRNGRTQKLLAYHYQGLTRQ